MKSSQYWDKAWSLVQGCTPCSPGCDHCWSASLAHRFMVEGEPGHRNGVITNDKGQFDGTVITRPDRLNIPLKTKKPTVFAVWNDLFHEDVPEEFIYKAFEAMFSYDTYLLLTKRAKRMADFIKMTEDYDSTEWPFVWFGCTVCNQQEVDEKIPQLLQVPGHKWLNIEPMLGPIDLVSWLFVPDLFGAPADLIPAMGNFEPHIEAVVVGCETGPHRRPCNLEWIRLIVEQCKAAGVPCFVKQIQLPQDKCYKGYTIEKNIVVHELEQFPEDLRVRELPWRVK